MATNFDQEEGSNPFDRLLRNGLVLTPIALAGYATFNSVSANSATNPIAAASAHTRRGRLGTAGEALGKNLKGKYRDRKQSLIKSGQSEIDKLLKRDHLDRIWEVTAKQNTVIQSLIETMSDPSSGIPESIITQYREQLMDVASDAVDSEDAKDVIQNIVRAIDGTNGDSVRERFAMNLNAFQDVGAQLQPPKLSLVANENFTRVPTGKIEDTLGKESAGMRRYNTLVKELGGNYVEVVKHQAQGGISQAYGRVYSGNPASDKSKFLALVPLDLGKDSASFAPVRANENLTTGYRANRYYLDAQEANRLFKSGGLSRDSLLKTVTQGGARVPLEDLFINELISRVEPSGQNGIWLNNKHQYGAWQRQFLAADWRVSSSGDSLDSHPYVQHLRQAGSFQHNFAQLTNFKNMGFDEQEALMRALATTPGMEAGVSAGRIMDRGFNNELTGTIGIYEGSALSELNTPGLASMRGGASDAAEVPYMRSLFPTTSRIEQVVGREAMFVGQGPARKLGESFTAGATSRYINGELQNMVGENIMWSKAVTGAMNKAIVLDVAKSGSLAGLAGSGAAYRVGDGVETVLTPFTKPIVDPKSRGAMGSKFLNEIIGDMQEGQMKRLTVEDLEKYSGFLGIGPNKLQRLRQDPRAKAFHIAYNVTENKGKKHINVFGMMERELETYKGFSLMHKGTVQSISEEMEKRVAGSGVLDALERLGIARQDRLYGYGDMLKKGTGFLDAQMASAVGMINKNQYNKLASEIKSGRAAKTLQLGDNFLARSTGATIMALKEASKGKSRAFAQEIGMTLAGVYHAEDLVKGSGTLKRSTLEQAIRTAFGDTAFDPENIIRIAAEGKVLAGTSMSLGTGVGDYGLGRGSVEPRFLSNLQFRLRRMGLDSKQSSDFMSMVYENKLGGGQHLSAASGMMRLAESVTGQVGAVDAATMLHAGVPSYGLDELSSLLPEQGQIGEVLARESHAGGMWLDLTKGAGTPAQHAMAEAARTVFKQGQVFIPGSEVLNAMRDTHIKTTEGNIHIQDEYSRMVQNFMSDMTTLQGGGQDVYKKAVKSMSSFKHEALGMASRTVHTVTGGKIRGMQAQVAGIYDLTGNTSFTEVAKGQLAWDIFKKTKGRAVFLDTIGFMSQLKDFMGGGLSTDDAAKKAEMFFLSLEGNGGAHAAKGVYGVSMRHPLLSIGNVQVTQMFRHLDETGAGARDVAFSKFVATEKGKKYAELGGFQGLLGDAGFAGKGAGGKAHNLRKTFFKDFVSSLDEWVGDGGGRVFLPRKLEDVHYMSNGKEVTATVDMGISGAAIGDWDGDQWYTMMTDEKMGRMLNSTLGKGAEKGSYLTASNIYKIKSEMFAEEAKRGLKKHGINVELGAAEAIQESLMKEWQSKAAVGALDVRLNMIRTSILDMQLDGPGQAQAEEALALLKVIQEHAVIKGKKLPVFKKFAAMIGSGVDEAMAGKGTGGLRRVLKDEVFPGSGYAGAGMQVSRMSAPAGSDYPSAQMYSQDVGKLGNEMIQLDKTMDFIDQAIGRGIHTGAAQVPSQGRLLKMFESGDSAQVEKAFNIIRGGHTAQGGAIAGFGRDAFRTIADKTVSGIAGIRAAAMNMDRKTAGLVAMGGMAALGMAGLVSSQGYSPDPMVVPGEVVPPRVKSGIAAQEVLRAQTEPRVTPEGMAPRHNASQMMSRPINERSTYMNKQNSYQVRGQIHSERGIGNMRNYLSSMGGGNYGGSVRINDARRPLTANYTDRMMGEY